MTVLRAGLIGDHIGQSRFARAMALMCDIHGWTLDFTPIDTAGREGFDLAAEVSKLRAKGWSGVTVTHPWKAEAAALGPGVEDLGAANILLFGDTFTARNTDHTGFLGAWSAEGHGPPGRVAIAGAGGVARAIGPALAKLGADDVAIWDPRPGAAETLAAQIGGRAVPMDAAPETVRAAHGLVNATALGMGGDTRSAFDPAWLGGQRWAFDAVYTPVHTPFLRAAHAAGIATITGFRLFQHMAIDSFAAYTGIEPNRPAMLAALAPLDPAKEE